MIKASQIIGFKLNLDFNSCQDTESSSLVDSLRRKSVAIYGNSQEINTAVLVALLPVAGRIYLLPRDLRADQVSLILDANKPDALVSSADSQFSVPVIEPVDLLENCGSASLLFAAGENLSCKQFADVVLATSGTTGRPKLVKHSFAFLVSTAKVSGAGDSSRRWGLVYDVCRFAGLQVAIQSLMSGSTLIIPELSWPVDQKVKFLVEHGVTHMSATPSFWRRWLMSPQASHAHLRRITLGGEIVDQSILNALAAVYPAATIVHIYASTEAGVGFTVSDRLEGFPAEFSGQVVNGVDIKVVDRRLYLRKAMGATGYISAEPTFLTADGFVNTGDDVELRGGRYIFLGRNNGSINIGGVKVFPEVTERRLLQHAHVQECIVYAVKSGVMGNTLNSTVVLKEGIKPENKLKFELMRWCRDGLEPEAVPTKITFADELSIQSSGKLQRPQA